MKNLLFLGLMISIVFIFTSSSSAEDIIEPEFIMTVDSWLTSNPQPGVDFHVIKVCKDYEMIEDCTQCIYKASVDGSLNIPVFNRCVFRADQEISFTDQVEHSQSYNLHYQLKAATSNGLESVWTEPEIVSIQKNTNNASSYSYALLFVQYNHE